MVLSKRERYIGISVMAAVGLLLLNFVVIVPLEDQKSDLSKEIKKKQAELGKFQSEIKRSRDLTPRWAEMNKSGLQRNASSSQSQLYNAVSSWARESNLTPPPALRSDRTEKDKDLTRIVLRGTGNGAMAPIARFLWHIQTATIPVRITDITITSRREGTDDLTLQLGVATAFLSEEAAPRGPTASLQREDR